MPVAENEGGRSKILPPFFILKMRNVKLVLQYDGTLYHGWQLQPGKKTVCGVFRENLRQVINEPAVVYASSRTDSGAHALGQAVNFRTASGIPARNIKDALNGMLPADISVSFAGEEDENFHACYSARRRKYRYTIRNASLRSPFDRFYSYHFPYSLGEADMKKAARHLLGSHDFSAFKSARGGKPDRMRTVELLDVRRDGDYIHIDIAADGFLTYMVRNIAGTLLEVGRRRFAPGEIKNILLSEDRKNAGPTLPARGLCLMKVDY